MDNNFTGTAGYLNPLTTFGFKRLFTNEENRHLLRDLINSLLLGEKRIVEVMYDPQKEETYNDHGNIILNFCCKDNHRKSVIVQLNLLVSQSAFRPGLESGFIRLADMRLAKEADMSDVIIISLLNFTTADFSGNGFIKMMNFENETTSLPIPKKVCYEFVYLPGFLRTEGECFTHLDKWLYLLKYMSRMRQIPAFFNKGIFKSLFDSAELSKLSEQDRIVYQESLVQSAKKG